jgi:membrane-associated phospholipid phosphatase
MIMKITKYTLSNLTSDITKYVLCIFSILILSQTAFSQAGNTPEPRKKIYHVNYITGSIIIAAGLASDYPAIGRIKNKANLTNDEILNLNTSILNPIDRWALHQNTSHYQLFSKLSDEVEPPIFVILPALLGLDKKIRQDWLDLLFMYCEGHVITFTFYNYSWLGPTFENKYRPITYYTNLSMADRTPGNNRNSAYSGHTASVAFTSFFLAKVYCDYHPDASKLFWYSMALIPPLAMGYLRVRALAHFPSDVATGLSVGALVGIVLPQLHKNPIKGVTLGLMTTPGAMGMCGFWTIPSQKPLHKDKSIMASICSPTK